MKSFEERCQWPWYESPAGVVLDLRRVCAVFVASTNGLNLFTSGDDSHYFTSGPFATKEAALAERALLLAELRKPRVVQVAVEPASEVKSRYATVLLSDGTLWVRDTSQRFWSPFDGPDPAAWNKLWADKSEPDQEPEP